MVACHCIGKKGAGLRKGARRWARQTTRGGLCAIDIACFALSFHERHPQMRGDGARIDALVPAAIARDERERDEPPAGLRGTGRYYRGNNTYGRAKHNSLLRPVCRKSILTETVETERER